MSRVAALPFHLAVFTGSFLLFVLELLIGRMLLPVYGNSASVWTTCLVYFQGLLLLGYAYAAQMSTARDRIRIWGHLAVVLLPLVTSPFHLSTFEGWPVWGIALSLSIAVGVPFFVLSSAGVMVQAWFARSAHPRRNDPYYLYASSNAGALAALFAYPFLIEPSFGLSVQRHAWFVAYVVHALLMATSAWVATKVPAVEEPGADRSATALPVPGDLEGQHQGPGGSISSRVPWVQWLLLAAGANGLLMATNNVVTLDAPVPLLWVVPLSIYLSTLIISFGPRVPSPRLQGLLSVAGLAVILVTLPFMVARVHHQIAFIVLNGAILWNGSLLCHARLARARPQDTRYLGRYYLAISAGGWLGAMLVGIVIPLALHQIAIPFLDYVAAFGLVLSAMLMRDVRSIGKYLRRKPSLAVFFVVLMGLVSVLGIMGVRHVVRGHVDSVRTFYGAYRVTDKGNLRWFQHGDTIHGVQRLDDVAGRQCLGYYHVGSPIAQILRSDMQFKTVGIVGLGAGALAAYEIPGQTWDFFELDPEVERIAREDFTYLRGAVVPTRVVIGDARLTLRDEPDHKFDLLVLDTFSSDFLPIHLVTLEAVELYFKKLAPDGLLVFHISSRLFDMAPVLARLAQRLDAYRAVSGVRGEPFHDTGDGQLPSRWFAMTHSAEKHTLLVKKLGWIPWNPERKKRDTRVWTDDYVNLFDAL